MTKQQAKHIKQMRATYDAWNTMAEAGAAYACSDLSRSYFNLREDAIRMGITEQQIKKHGLQ